jgi:hypothetical protein
MATKPRGSKAKTKLVAPDEAKRRHDVMDEAILDFEGTLDELEGALGMYMIGRHFGWKVLYLIHSKKTVAKYEAILKIKVSEEFEPETPDSTRSNAFKAIQHLTNFWKIVSGEEKLPLDRAERRSLQ